MGMTSFFKEAGQKLFGHKDTEATALAAQAAPDDATLQANTATANQTAGTAIETYIAAQQLEANGLRVEFDGATSTATVMGEAADQATKEKILLCCGNVHGVAGVNDMMTVTEAAAESQYYTVESGNTLSGISKQFYGTPNQYMKIFEANTPMLGHPDKIYPGQLLRVPA